MKAKDKKTGEIVRIFCWDDYFGRHQYGYRVENDKDPNTNPMMTESEYNKKYKQVEE